MKKTFFLLLIVFLVGCGPVSNTPAAGEAQPIAPNVAAEYAKQTKQANLDQAAIAQQQEDFLNSQSTATSAAMTQIAFAPYAAATQAAVEIQIQKMYSEATSTAAAQTQTAYAEQQIFMAQSTTIAGQTTATAKAAEEEQRLIIESNNRKIERDRTTNTMKAVAIYAVLFILVIIGVMFSYVFLKRLSFSQPGVDDFGKPLPILNYIDAVVTDLDKATNGTVGITQKFLAQLPVITAERQGRVTISSHLLDMNTRRAVPKRLIDSQHAGLLPVSSDPAPDMQDADLLLPAWDIINGWDGQSRPLGLGHQGIIVAQAASPHLLTTGGTGSGKTAFMLRTQATASLAKGYQVINIGFSESGFGVFAEHPNFHSVKLEQSSDVIDCLASVYKELKERKAIIGGESIEWEHWRPGQLPPRPFVDVLIDELGNLADDIFTSEETSKEGAVRTAQLWRWMSMIAKEGRKVGIRFLAALQDPTAKSVNLSFRRNCTLVSFQLGDASQSRSFIGVAGAELLQVGHFMTRNFTGTEEVVIGGGFAPTDSEIKSYLRTHQAPQTPAPTWIDGVIVGQPALPRQETIQLSAPAPAVMTKGEFVNGLSEWETQALSLYEDGLEPRYIVETVFAGDDLRVGTAAVGDLIARWKEVKGNGAGAPQAEEDSAKKRDEEIIRRYVEKQSLAKIQREVFGDTTTGGNNFQKIKSVIAQYENTTTKATTTGENMPISPNLRGVVA